MTPEGSWAPVPVLPDSHKSAAAFPPILVNIGDLLTYWTDGLLKSTVHRVVFPVEEREDQNNNPNSRGRDRYSVVYFCHPLETAELVPVPSKIVAAFREKNDWRGERDGQVGFGGGAGSWAPGKRALTAAEHLESRLNATYGFQFRKDG